MSISETELSIWYGAAGLHKEKARRLIDEVRALQDEVWMHKGKADSLQGRVDSVEERIDRFYITGQGSFDELIQDIRKILDIPG